MRAFSNLLSLRLPAHGAGEGCAPHALTAMFPSWCCRSAAGAKHGRDNVLEHSVWGEFGEGRGKKAVRSIAGNLDSETFHLQFPQVLNWIKPEQRWKRRWGKGFKHSQLNKKRQAAHKKGIASLGWKSGFTGQGGGHVAEPTLGQGPGSTAEGFWHSCSQSRSQGSFLGFLIFCWFFEAPVVKSSRNNRVLGFGCN